MSLILLLESEMYMSSTKIRESFIEVKQAAFTRLHKLGVSSTSLSKFGCKSQFLFN